MASTSGTSVAAPHSPLDLPAGQIRLRYDALSDVGTGRLVGLRADLVWDHPAWGRLPAEDVWAAAGRRHQDRALRRWLLEEACRDVARLPDTLHVGVQLPADLVDAGRLPDDVSAALTATALRPERLALALPEALVRHARDEVAAALHMVHAAGVRLCLTGHGVDTALEGLVTRVPLDAVVVSLRDLRATGGFDQALRGIAVAAGEVGVRTIAADVLTADQAALLRGQASGVSSSASARSPGVS